MGNTQQTPSPPIKHRYKAYEEELNEKDAADISENYKVIKVNSISQSEVNDAAFRDNYFQSHPEQLQLLDDMVMEYCGIHRYEEQYKTHYICSKKEQLCICNMQPEYSTIFKKSMGLPPVVAWVKKRDEPL